MKQKQIQNTKYADEVRVCIAIQKIGKATVNEIKEKLEEDGVKMTPKKIQKACDNLQKRGLVSLNYDTSNGIREKAYSMSKSIFSRDIPIAHYKDLVDTSDTEIRKLIDELDQSKKTSKGRLPDHRNYYDVNVTFEVVDKILGFMPFNEDGYNEHYRQGNNIILLPTHFRAWFGTNLRTINKTERMKNYIGFDYGYVQVKGKTTREEFPVLDGGQGRGIVKYEVIPAGSLIETRFKVPETDFTSNEFKKFLEDIGKFPIRGLSGRAITGYGHVLVKSFKVQ